MTEMMSGGISVPANTRLAGRSARTATAIATLTVVGAIAAGVAFLAAQTPVPAPSSGLTGIADLEHMFRTPPDDARIMMRWWWFGPTVTKARLEREMRLMKAGGIGGFEIQPVYPVVLDDPALGFETHAFLSDAFLDHVRFTAVKARELGLRVDLTIGSGWPYGGPQIGVTQAAGKLRVERAVVPSGAGRVPVPDIRPGERLMAAFLAPVSPAFTTKDLREISRIGDGVLVLPDCSHQARDVLFFISSRTGMMVKRPAVGAEGFVLNHYDRTAVDHYLAKVGDRLLSAFDTAPPYAVFCDSLEVYESDWTGDFLEAFKARRGYDLRPLLPALVLDAGPATAAIRHDWGQTLTELLNERFLAPMQEWAARHGTKFRIQGYGIPPATISSNAAIDLPEGEGAQWKTLRASRWAASIGHLYDRPVISSETWTWLHSPSFMATPLDMKAEADLHFLQGINQLIGHGWPYTADGVADPGWRFYAAGVFNDRNPWWIVMPDVAQYLQRVSFLMRQGKPANDIAFYLPNDDAWARFVPGKSGVHRSDEPAPGAGRRTGRPRRGVQPRLHRRHGAGRTRTGRPGPPRHRPEPLSRHRPARCRTDARGNASRARGFRETGRAGVRDTAHAGAGSRLSGNAGGPRRRRGVRRAAVRRHRASGCIRGARRRPFDGTRDPG